MSAVAGIACFDGRRPQIEEVGRMTGAMRHRGPDAITALSTGPVAFGHCALRTTPESVRERQPLANARGDIVLVLDGRVDNRCELRRELEARGATLRDDTDAELVLHAYDLFGHESPDRIIGEFAFMAWDHRTRSMFGARDAIGTRHFYYHHGAGRTAFASEIKGLLALGDIPVELNEGRFIESLVISYDRDDQVSTCYRGIDRLPAGHAMRVSEAGLRTWRWWDPSQLPEQRYASVDECAEAFREVLRMATSCRLRGGGRIGAALSGGLDSSSVVGMAALASRSEGREPLETFTLVHADRAACPELRHATLVARAHSLPSTLIGPELAQDVWRARVADIASADEPFAVHNNFTDQLVAEAAREKGCNVLFDGMAGDLVCYWFEESVTLRPYGLRRLPGILRAARRHGEGHVWRMVRTRAASALTPRPVRRWYRDRRGLSALPEDGLLLRREVAQKYLLARMLARPWRRASTEQEYHANVYKSGLLSYPHEGYGQVAFRQGIEPRSPFSDRRMAEFAVRTPYSMKAACEWYKRVMRVGARDYLPDAVRWREDVTMHPGAEFRTAFVHHLSRHAPEIWNREFVERRMSPWVDTQRLREIWARHEASGGLFDGLFLLAIVMTAHWLDARFGHD